jgi:hypothetical protein
MKTRSHMRNEKIVTKPVVKLVTKPVVVFEKMRTRFQARNEALAAVEEIPKAPVENFFIPSEPMIDFDDASACWRANKKHLGNGMFKYVRRTTFPFNPSF